MTLETRDPKAARTDGPASARRPGLILFVCCAGQFLVVLDGSVVNVALPLIDHSLGLRADTLPWVVNAYTIVFAGALLLGGRLADLFGRRRMYLAGITLFSLAALAGGTAGDPATLVVARGVQGLGAAIMAPTTLSVLGTVFTDPRARARAFGMWSAVAGAGGAIGVLAGGLIAEWLSWRWTLLVNVPVGILLFALAAVAVPPRERSGRDRDGVDVPGAVSVTLGLMLLVYAVAGTETHGWTAPRTAGLLAAGLGLLGFFVLDQARIARHPLVPLSIFRIRQVTAANITAFACSAALFSTFYFFTLLLQNVLGYSPLQTGLAYLPMTAGLFAGARGIAPVVQRLGPRPVLLAGHLLSAAGLGWLSLAGTDATFTGGLLGPGLLLGVGQGMVMTSLTIAATADLPYHQSGLASGLLNTTRQLGGAVGLALLVTVANGRAADHSSGTGGPGAGGGAGEVSREALASGYGLAFATAAGFLALGVLGALAVPRRKAPSGTDT
ncbi:MFS transporter [Streptomyces xinghaiensis]|uniref:MFS transporter n=1 Tax=Streptomyces xinghaiensis TaxID=1038928 RepID=UPI0034262FEE